MAEHERCACGAVPELWGPPVCRWVRCPQCRWSGPNSDSAEDAWASWDSVMRAVREARDNAEEFTRLYAGPHERAAHAETKRLLREVTKDTCWHCVEEKARQILEGYALIFDNKVADITALRDNLRRDAGLPEKTDD
jgi:hypothetical protein